MRSFLRGALTAALIVTSLWVGASPASALHIPLGDSGICQIWMNVSSYYNDARMHLDHRRSWVAYGGGGVVNDGIIVQRKGMTPVSAALLSPCFSGVVTVSDPVQSVGLEASGQGYAALSFTVSFTDGSTTAYAFKTPGVYSKVDTAPPTSTFEQNVAEIKSGVAAEGLRSVSATVSSNVRLMQETRARLVQGSLQAGGDNGPVGRSSTSFSTTGSADLRDATYSSRGAFFGETGSYGAGPNRLLFGDFDVQRDADGSVSAQLNAKLAWERQISTTTMIGYYLGANLGRATLEGAFAGDQDSFGASVGAYFVTEFQPNLYLDGFTSLGLGSNALALDNGILNVASDYTTTTGTVGGSLTGVVEGNGYEFWPQMQLTYGHTHIGKMSFTGSAASLVDDNLSMDAGFVSMASATFTPAFKVPLGGGTVADSNALLTFAPRLICERTVATDTTNDCGGGAEIGMESRSRDGLSNLSVNIRSDLVGSTTRTGLGLNFEHAF